MNGRLACVMHGLAVAAAAIVLGCSGESTGVGGGPSGGIGRPTGTDSDGASPEGSALFDSSSSASRTPGSIYGVWAGSLTDGGIQFDLRFKHETRTLTMAARCTMPNGKQSSIVSVTAAAIITDDNFSVLESKRGEVDDGEVRCSATLSPRELGRCEYKSKAGFETSCFVLEGTRLVIYGDTPLEKMSLTKLSD